MPPGLVAGTETVVFYSLFLVWPAQQITLFSVMATLVFGNVALRLLWAKRHLRDGRVAAAARTPVSHAVSPST
jgi:hypothetical protein